MHFTCHCSHTIQLDADVAGFRHETVARAVGLRFTALFFDFDDP